MKRIMLLVGALLVAVMVPAAAHAAPAAGGAPDVRITAPFGAYHVGDSIPITVSVTNRSASACGVVARGDASLAVDGWARDGMPVAGAYATQSFLDGYASAIGTDIRSVAPGATVSFTVDVSPGRPLATKVPASTSEVITSTWQLSTPGRYRLALRYAPPMLAGLPMPLCAGAAGTATVAVTIGPAGTSPWLPVVIAVIAAMVLAILLVAVWWLLRRRRRRPGVAAGLLVLLVASVAASAIPARSAQASIDVPPPASAAFSDAVASCLGSLGGSDPEGIVSYFKGPNSPPVVIRPVDRWQDMETTDEPGNPAADITITWMPDRKGFFPSDTAYEPCPGLLHELSHAYDHAHGLDAEDAAECDSTDTSVGQVRAMLIENIARRAIGAGPHDHDGLDKIPDSLDKCADKRDDAHTKYDTSSCRPQGGIPLDSGGCGVTNGDPHLTTFDGHSYDFQTVGEFVLARSGNDLEVQVRQAALPGSRQASINAAVAVRAGLDRIGFYLQDGDIVVHVNGHVLTPSAVADLTGAVTLSRRPAGLPGNGDGFTIAWPDGSRLWIDKIGSYGLITAALLAPARTGTTVGLLGNDDGKPGNDLVAGSRTLESDPTFDQIHGAFADTWRVTAAGSLFDYAPGQTTTTFTDRSFPYSPTSISAADRARATALCASMGVLGAALDACALDVVLTGQPAFAAAAAVAQRAMSAMPRVPTLPGSQPTPTPVAPGEVVRDGSAVSGVISRPDQTVDYDVDAGQATVIRLLDVTGEPGQPQIDLIGPPATTPGFTITNAYQYRVDPALHYRLRVSFTGGSTGTYTFRLVTAKERRIATTVGATVTGTLDDPGRVDIYTVRAEAAGALTLHGGSPCTGVNVTSTDDSPSPEAFTPFRLCDEVTIGNVVAGSSYDIIIWSDTGSVGAYTFTTAVTG